MDTFVGPEVCWSDGCIRSIRFKIRLGCWSTFSFVDSVVDSVVHMVDYFDTDLDILPPCLG